MLKSPSVERTSTFHSDVFQSCLACWLLKWQRADVFARKANLKPIDFAFAGAIKGGTRLSLLSFAAHLEHCLAEESERNSVAAPSKPDAAAAAASTSPKLPNAILSQSVPPLLVIKQINLHSN